MQNMTRFFSLAGMNYLIRKMANLAHPTFIFERISDNQIKVVNRTTFMENTTIYTYGEPATVKNPNGETLVRSTLITLFPTMRNTTFLPFQNFSKSWSGKMGK